MPEKHVEVTWTCSICGIHYAMEQAARECEDQGFAIPEFKELELVDIEIDGKRFVGCVWDCAPHEVRPNQHLLPSSYDVVISLCDYNPFDQKIPDRDPFFGATHTLFRCAEIIGSHSVKEGACCPRCSSTEIRLETESAYHPYNVRRGMLAEVELSECGSCCLRFLNDAQSRRIDELFREQLGDKKVLDTEKLRQEDAYDAN